MPHFSSSALLFAHPLQGATVYALPISTGSKFLLTRPSRGATILYLILCIVYSISTHTPLAGRDCNNLCLEFLNKNFYSHAPRGARRLGICRLSFLFPFLLTRPSRGATLAFNALFFSSSISTHTPLAGRDVSAIFTSVALSTISTHTPHAGRDEERLRGLSRYTISTHTTLAGRDFFLFLSVPERLYFYSHAPRGARQLQISSQRWFRHFYSHAPRGARRKGND